MNTYQANSDRREIVVIGGGGHARVVISVLQGLTKTIAGYTALEPNEAMHCEYLGTDEFLFRQIDPDRYAIALGIGLPRINSRRLDLLNRILDHGIAAPPIVSTRSMISDDVELGDGTVIFDGAIVAVGTSIGRGAIINHNASIDHDCLVGENVHIAPSATLCGDVKVGADCVIGAGATVLPGIQIVEGCEIGAGSTVTKDILRRGTYIGSPARPSRPA